MNARKNIYGVVQMALALSEIVEAELVHRGCTERPRMAQIPLLGARLEVCAESRNVCSGGLEGRKRIGVVVVFKVVVGSELLRVGDFVVQANRELILALGFFADRGTVLRVGAGIGVRGDPLVVNRLGSRVKARSGDDVTGKDVREQGACGNRATADCGHSLLAACGGSVRVAGAACEQTCERRVNEGADERRARGAEVPGLL